MYSISDTAVYPEKKTKDSYKCLIINKPLKGKYVNQQ
jgi:hypothetical protein